MIVPSAKTAVSLRTFSRIDPYRTVVVPAAPVEAIPPIVASAPGSTEKKRPSDAIFLFSAIRLTPACTRTVKSSGLISRILSIVLRSREIPPNIGNTWPSREVPAPNATTGMSCLLQYFKTSETSSVDCTVTTADGFTGRKADSSLPCRSKTDSLVEMRPLTRAPRSEICSEVNSLRMRIFLFWYIQTVESPIDC